MVNEPTATPFPRPKNNARESGSERGSRLARVAPVLASDVLREDVAPLRPWERAFRIWQAVLAGIVIVGGVLSHMAVVPSPPANAWLAYGLGAALIALAAVPLPYVARGACALLLGMTTAAFGLLGWGPLEGLADHHAPFWSAAKIMAATALPAALLFRARYRAYLGARVALLVALAVALPAAVNASMTLVAGPLFASIAAALTLAAVLTSLLGFMGEGTTAASTAWAVFVVVVFGAEVMARSLWLGAGWTSAAGNLHAGLMLMVVCTLTSTGLFQLLAAAFAADARCVDVLRNRQPSIHYANSVE